ncbi:hypothetical protein K0M31_010082 [Melipona bicolor]|uniref:Uncharacterized protein n=1 Tax=Melipona bicolor TaxID=60889 RepID=A0AA40FN17_9HYME|nr:hypothetical protein K0M31_010082 [Melipona bicolor]
MRGRGGEAAPGNGPEEGLHIVQPLLLYRTPLHDIPENDQQISICPTLHAIPAFDSSAWSPLKPLKGTENGLREQAITERNAKRAKYLQTGFRDYHTYKKEKEKRYEKYFVQNKNLRANTKQSCSILELWCSFRRDSLNSPLESAT